MPTDKDAGQTTTTSRKRQLPEAKIQDHLKSNKISAGKRYKFSTTHLPGDLLYEICLRLPVKSVIRFRSVSKGMREMIDSSFFAKKHNNHRSSISDDYAIILDQSRRLLSVNCSKDNPNRAEAIELNFTLPRKKGMFLVGCCNGIFCFKKTEPERYVLWNPSNGTVQKVVCPNLPPKTNIPDSIGYDYVNDDYKIARVRDDTCLEVYSFSKKSWRTFNGILPSDPFPIGKGVCVSGAMHWLSTNPRFIVAFDFVTETFRSLPLPQEAGQLEAYGLMDFGSHLCVAFSPSVDVALYTVWVMEKYGVETSWTKLYNTNTIPLYYFPNQEGRLLCNFGWLTWWDPQDNSFEKIEFPGPILDQPRYTKAHIYVRNLVRLDHSESLCHKIKYL